MIRKAKLGQTEEYDPKVEGPAILELIELIRPGVKWLKLHTMVVVIPCVLAALIWGRTRLWVDIVAFITLILFAPNLEEAQFQHEREKKLILQWYENTKSYRAKRFLGRPWFDEGVEGVVKSIRKKRA